MGTSAHMMTFTRFLLTHDIMDCLYLLICVLGPYAFMLVAIPAIYNIVFQVPYTTVMLNLVLGELLTNIHTFVTITTNHTGNDMYVYHTSCKPNTGEFYLRQIISSTNFTTTGRFTRIIVYHTYVRMFLFVYGRPYL